MLLGPSGSLVWSSSFHSSLVFHVHLAASTSHWLCIFIFEHSAHRSYDPLTTCRCSPTRSRSLFVDSSSRCFLQEPLALTHLTVVQPGPQNEWRPDYLALFGDHDEPNLERRLAFPLLPFATTPSTWVARRSRSAASSTTETEPSRSRRGRVSERSLSVEAVYLCTNATAGPDFPS
jgi:hypothetical protein